MYLIFTRTIDSDSIISIVEKRRTSSWYEDYSYFYDGYYQVALNE